MVGYSAGSASNLLAQMIAPTLSQELGQPVEIVRVQGENGARCAHQTARAVPDGQTVLIAAQSHVIEPLLHPGSAHHYDLATDFAPIALVAKKPDVLAVSTALGVGTVEELIRLAQSRPGELTYAASAIGGVPHLAGALFCAMAGIDMRLRVYTESAALFEDLARGRVAATFNNILSVLPLARGGSIRMLAVTGATRSTTLQELPTIAEAALPGYEMLSWMGILAPAATARDTVLQLHAAVCRTMQAAEVSSALKARGTEPIVAPPEALAQHINGELERWRQFIKLHGTAFAS